MEDIASPLPIEPLSELIRKIDKQQCGQIYLQKLQKPSVGEVYSKWTLVVRFFFIVTRPPVFYHHCMTVALRQTTYGSKCQPAGVGPQMEKASWCNHLFISCKYPMLLHAVLPNENNPVNTSFTICLNCVITHIITGTKVTFGWQLVCD